MTGDSSLPRTEGSPYLAFFWRDVGINCSRTGNSHVLYQGTTFSRALTKLKLMGFSPGQSRIHNKHNHRPHPR
jgi:hypothetical protein